MDSADKKGHTSNLLFAFIKKTGGNMSAIHSIFLSYTDCHLIAFSIAGKIPSVQRGFCVRREPGEGEPWDWGDVELWRLGVEREEKPCLLRKFMEIWKVVKNSYWIRIKDGKRKEASR
jgi:hypothetical protein